MITLLSPAKKLDFETKVDVKLNNPAFINKAVAVNKVVKQLSTEQIGSLQSISEKLSALNFERNQQWNDNINDTTKAALYSFKGDVYVGLDAESLLEEDVDFAQKHLRILSGLYGILKPLDGVMPYRLEMGTRLSIGTAKNLYAYWQEDLTNHLLAEAKAQNTDLIVNLASKEYAKAIIWKQVDLNVIEPVFKDWKVDKYKIISFFAKKARGLMARYIIDNRITAAANLKAFDYGGYTYNEELSNAENTMVFTRKE